MDTIRWTTPVNPKPPIGNAPAQPGVQPGMPGETYRLALLLPFLTNQMEGNAVPEKSRLALQFYAGAKIALEEISQTENINLVVNVYDTQINDADFLQLLNDARLNRSDVFIGPVRNSHLSAMSSWTKQHHKILVSPESPTSELTAQNPDFIQTNPSLRAHCEAITQYVLAKHGADAVTLVCKEREADRLPYFHQANALPGSRRFSELIVPDATANFDKIDLRPYLKAGRTSVFILPTWASQDFVMAFLRKLRTAKGNYDVEVYGMPQWASYESIEPEYFRTLNVHISSASYIDYSAPEVRVFQQKFYDATGTIPDDDGFNGYDVTLYVGRMLRRYGLSFPFRVQAEPMEGLHNTFRFQRIFNNGAIDDGFNTPDYLENTHVHILKFEQYGFVPAE
ncbi:MAG: ABC transporter substrate-binding protein [Lewinellaceae bacterium]|nr:ABC transporter substrate-binding protein [Lewinellaceae bacterium]